MKGSPASWGSDTGPLDISDAQTLLCEELPARETTGSVLASEVPLWLFGVSDSPHCTEKLSLAKKGLSMPRSYAGTMVLSGMLGSWGFCIMAGNKLFWYLRVALLWRNLWQWSFHVRFWFAAPVSSSFFTLSDPSSAASQNSWSTGASQIPGLSWCMARSVLYVAGPWYIFCSKLACLKLSWHLLSHLLTYPITGTWRPKTVSSSKLSWHVSALFPASGSAFPYYEFCPWCLVCETVLRFGLFLVYNTLTSAIWQGEAAW